MKKVKDTFCPLPWLGSCSTTEGHYRPCCVYEYITSNNNHWTHQTLQENIDKLAPLRKAFLNGEKPEVCKRCWADEKIGTQSIRQTASKRYKNMYDDILANTDIDGNTSIQPIYFDMKLSNLCNLGCRMCAPSISSVLEAEVRNNPAEQWNTWQNLPTFKKGWDDVAFEKISKTNPNKLKFTGGEPFANPKIFDFLDSLNNKKEIDLEFITNGLLVTDRYFSLFDKFKSINILVSCDGVEEVYDYIRWPGKWKNFDKKIKEIKTNIENPHVVAVISAYNIRNINRMVDYFADYEFTMQPLHTPIHMHPWVEGVLDPSFLDEKSHPDIKNIKSSFKKYKKSLYKEFVKETKIRDRLRKQNFWKMIGNNNG